MGSYEDRLTNLIRIKKRRIFNEAFKRGLGEGEKNASMVVANLNQELNKINSQKLSLIGEIASELIENELIKDPQLIIRMSERLLKNLVGLSRVEISLHPADALIMKSFLNDEQNKNGLGQTIDVVEKDSFMRGSLVIKTRKSIINAKISDQIGRAKKLLGFRKKWPR